MPGSSVIPLHSDRVWIGYDDDDITLGGDETGGHAACPIWLYFMEDYLREQPTEKFPVPEDIVFAWVRARSSGSDEETPGKSVYAAFRKDQLRVNPNRSRDQDASDESGKWEALEGRNTKIPWMRSSSQTSFSVPPP